MLRQKVDQRIRVLIENNVKTRMRSMFVVVGDRAMDQVVVLHHMMSKAAVKARPTVLWCYKKDLGFNSNRSKRLRGIQKKIKTGNISTRKEDLMDLFTLSTAIQYCHYKDTHKILGNTYGICVLQDFEALTPNLLAHTIETVEGGGVIVVLLKKVESLQQLYTMTMDVHSRYKTAANLEVTPRFNERFILSLKECANCLVTDDELNILPISSAAANIMSLSSKHVADLLSGNRGKFSQVRQSPTEKEKDGALINCCKTIDQAEVLVQFIKKITKKTLSSTVALTAARGRGKSAALGLAVASAVAYGYSNMFVTSPTPENLKTLFEFILKGLDSLGYVKHTDYDIVQSTNEEFNKAIVRVNIYRDHRQTIQYIHPTDAHKLGQAELVVIDEAAAIPLPLVKSLMGPHLVLMASTVNGYEGTGRSLSLKLIKQLREQATTTSSGCPPLELTLKEPIRYAEGDLVEAWLNQLLCLDATEVENINCGDPLPERCDLYYVNRDALFSFHKTSEEFLQKIMSLYVSSHYKNTPNDLQMLSDSPSHHIFVLLAPEVSGKTLPEVLVVLQVCIEGKLSQKTVLDGLHRGQRASGDLIPWTISQQFRNDKFAQMSGARIVRIATHPDYQGRGYGKRAINVLESYYKHKIPSNIEEPKATTFKDAILETKNLLKEVIKPRSSTELPPLISKLSERKPESLDYLGVSYGLTSDLLRFWKKCGFLPVYLRQTQNALTGENSCIMLKILNEEEKREDESSWLKPFNQDFRRRFISLLSYQFKSYLPSMALSLLQIPKTVPESGESKSATAKLTSNDLSCYFTHNDIERLKAYSNKLVDYHLIMDLVPQIAKLYFIGNMPDVNLAIVQQALLLGTGLQHKQVDELEEELHLSSTQILGVLYKVIRKCYQPISCVGEEDAKIKLLERDNTTTDLTCQSLCQGEGEVKTSREISHNKTAKERLSIKRTDGNKKKRKLSIEADLGAARKKKEKRETLAQS